MDLSYECFYKFLVSIKFWTICSNSNSTIKFLNFRMQENFAVIKLKFKERDKP